MPDDLADEVLRRFVQGDAGAFEMLFRQFERDVYRWALWIVRDPPAAEDVVVEAFWRAYRGRARFDPARGFLPWIRRIATNVARDHLGSLSRRPSPLPVADDIAGRADYDAALAESLALAFARLPRKLRVVATLALIEGRPYGEIADALAIPEGTVKSRAFRAVRALRKELARLGVRP